MMHILTAVVLSFSKGERVMLDWPEASLIKCEGTFYAQQDGLTLIKDLTCKNGKFEYAVGVPLHKVNKKGEKN